MTTTIGSLDLGALSDLRDDVTQYFWFESDSSSAWGSGAHVTLYPESQFTDSTSPNYMKGQNIIMNTDGFSIRNGGLPMMVLDSNSLDFNVVDTTAGTYTTTATFTATGAQIGQSGGAHSVIDANGQRFYVSTVNGIIQLANIGYGEVNNGNANSMGAYYSFGTRAIPTSEYSTSRVYSIGNICIYNGAYYVCIADMDEPGSFNNSYWDKLIGALSFASGFSTIASGYASHAEGNTTKAIDMHAHAEGHYTIASMSSSHAEGYMTHAHGLYSHTEGRETFADAYASHAEGYKTVATLSSGSGSLPWGSHAEGMYTQASGQASHAEGKYSQAIGDYSHAQNMYTIATENNQTVIGKYNSATVSGSGTTEDPYTYSDVGNYAFIVGNGTRNTTADRSNALTVDWSGNLTISGDIIDGYGNKLSGSTTPPVKVVMVDLPSKTYNGNSNAWIYNDNVSATSVTGYTPIAVMQSTPFSGAGELVVQISLDYATYGSRFIGLVRNTGSTARTGVITIPVLYIRNDLV